MCLQFGCIFKSQLSVTINIYNQRRVQFWSKFHFFTTCSFGKSETDQNTRARLTFMALVPGTHYKHECHSKALFAVFILFPLTQIKFCTKYANITKRTVLENSWFTCAWIIIVYLSVWQERSKMQEDLFVFVHCNKCRQISDSRVCYHCR